jgi:hypothetical protein
VSPEIVANFTCCLDRIAPRDNVKQHVYQLSRQSQPSRKRGAESGGSLTHKNKTKMADLPKDRDPYGVLGILLFLAACWSINELAAQCEYLEYWWRFIAIDSS